MVCVFPGEPEFWRFLISFGRPLPIVLCFGGGVVCSPNVVVAVAIVTGEASPWSLSESWTLNILDDLVKRPSGPRGPVPRLVLFSCTSSEMGLLLIFLCKILLSDVVIVCLVPDMAICVLSEYALSNFGLFIFFQGKGTGIY